MPPRNSLGVFPEAQRPSLAERVAGPESREIAYRAGDDNPAEAECEPSVHDTRPPRRRQSVRVAEDTPACGRMMNSMRWDAQSDSDDSCRALPKRGVAARAIVENRK